MNAIYGIKKNDKYYYIGKLSNNHTDKSTVCKSRARIKYFNSNIRNLFSNNSDVEVVVIKNIDNDWFDEKLLEIRTKYLENHPLVNTQWMLEGKRGYWQGTKGYWFGKTKDEHTIKRLTESKFKRVVQYDSNGKLIKIYESQRDVVEYLKCDKSKLSSILSSKLLKTKFRNNSYWFDENYLNKLYGNLPSELDLNDEKINLSRKNQPSRLGSEQKFTSRFTVIYFDNDNKLIKTFENADIAGDFFGLTPHYIRNICSGRLQNSNINLKYGEKLRQTVNHK